MSKINNIESFTSNGNLITPENIGCRTLDEFFNGEGQDRDDALINWTSDKDLDKDLDKKNYALKSSIIKNISSGHSWEDACDHHAAKKEESNVFAVKCIGGTGRYAGFGKDWNMWLEWLEIDNDCKPELLDPAEKNFVLQLVI